MLYDNLTNLYPIQRTLRFELKPVGKTLDNLIRSGYLDKDEERHKDFLEVKKYCDEYHKYFIDKALDGVSLKNIQEYGNLLEKTNRTGEEKEKLGLLEIKLREEIGNIFLEKYKEECNDLFSKKLLEKTLISYYENDVDKISKISKFKRFTTYFSEYNNNRKHIYSSDKKLGTIAYRLINENFPIFISNKKNYLKVRDLLANEISNLCSEFNEYLQIDNIDKVFDTEYFNNTLSQKGIEIYNLIISGKSLENGEKIKGINEYINLYNQKNHTRYPKLKELYKQIMSDRETISFKYDNIATDEEMIDIINEFFINYKKVFIDEITGKNKLEDLIEHISEYDMNCIFISNDSTITKISKDIYDDWSYINNAIHRYYDSNYKGKKKIGTKQYEDEKRKYLKKIEYYSMTEISKIIKCNIGEYFEKYIKENNLTNIIMEKFEEYRKNIFDDEKKKDKKVESIKELLDSIKILQEFIKVLIPEDNTLEKDSLFYNELTQYYDLLKQIIPIYNKVRNYVTKKPYSIEKFKLNFENDTLLEGWDVNKEKANFGVMFLKDGNYYLGIIDKNKTNIFDKIHECNSDEECYKKMNYKLLPGPNKMLPKVFFSKSRIDEFGATPQLLENYKKGKHKKGKDFDLKFCHELIDFYKQAINKHEDWRKFNFNFKNTSDYNSIKDFYDDISDQAYIITYKNISQKNIDELVKNGNLYLFQIYNKDFSKYSNGNQNLHTMYWNAIFDKENTKDSLFKLNGKAEIFYRKASLKLEDTAIHKAYFPIKNKNTNNPKLESVFKYDLIKNRRYTVDKFQFHVPITINYKSKGVEYINHIVNKYIKSNNDFHIIGIDRGERNLIYISVIDLDGNIIIQKSLNFIKNYNDYITDYHQLLDDKEKDRKDAKKNWNVIENIKELKEGYMSQVIHEITNIVKDKNAILVLEDLNSGFKNSRAKVEKQVYQKFEKMLADKFNYVVYKNNKMNDIGGVLKGYQLSNSDAFNKNSRQNGIIYYVSAWNTSKIDPVSGFVNLFTSDMLKYSNLDNAKNFVKKIDDIRFNENDNCFEFDINYAKYENRYENTRRKWTLSSHGKRIVTFRNTHKNNNWDYKEIDLTEEFKKLFNKDEYRINYESIKKDILNKGDTHFYNSKIEDNNYGFMFLFKLMLQMRNSISGTSEDYIISPIKSTNGYFNSKNKVDTLPYDADANGAFNIARKGLMIVNQIKNTPNDKIDKIKFDIRNEDWLIFVQNEGKV